MRILPLVSALLLGAFSTVLAQETVLAPGTTITIRADTIPVVHDTVDITAPWACPDGWTCTEDPVDTSPPDQVRWNSVVLSIEGDTLDIDWTPSSGSRSYTVWVRNTAANQQGTLHSAQAPPVRHPLTERGTHTVGITAINTAGQATTTWKQVAYSGTQIGFRIPEPVPMEDGLMVQAVFPLADVRPIADYAATLNGQPGTSLPDDLGWYWLPAPPTGTILIEGPNENWSQTYD